MLELMALFATQMPRPSIQPTLRQQNFNLSQSLQEKEPYPNFPMHPSRFLCPTLVLKFPMVILT